MIYQNILVHNCKTLTTITSMKELHMVYVDMIDILTDFHLITKPGHQKELRTLYKNTLCSFQEMKDSVIKIEKTYRRPIPKKTGRFVSAFPTTNQNEFLLYFPKLALGEKIFVGESEQTSSWLFVHGIPNIVSVQNKTRKMHIQQFSPYWIENDILEPIGKEDGTRLIRYNRSKYYKNKLTDLSDMDVSFDPLTGVIRFDDQVIDTLGRNFENHCMHDTFEKIHPIIKKDEEWMSYMFIRYEQFGKDISHSEKEKIKTLIEKTYHIVSAAEAKPTFQQTYNQTLLYLEHILKITR